MNTIIRKNNKLFLSGWVHPNGDKTNKIDVYIDGKLYLTANADLYRADLVSEGMQHSNFAFKIELPSYLVNTKECEIDVYLILKHVRMS